MVKIPPFWRRFQLRATPTKYWAKRRLAVLVRRNQITEQQAREMARQVDAA